MKKCGVWNCVLRFFLAVCWVFRWDYYIWDNYQLLFLDYYYIDIKFPSSLVMTNLRGKPVRHITWVLISQSDFCGKNHCKKGREKTNLETCFEWVIEIPQLNSWVWERDWKKREYRGWRWQKKEIRGEKLK
jgi:hypothetical protein